MWGGQRLAGGREEKRGHYFSGLFDRRKEKTIFLFPIPGERERKKNNRQPQGKWKKERKKKHFDKLQLGGEKVAGVSEVLGVPFCGYSSAFTLVLN